MTVDGLYHEPQGITLATGELTRTPKSPNEGLFVVIPSFGDQHVFGPCGWSPPPNGRLPQKGGSCLVAFDENFNPWIVALEAASATSSDLVSALPASPYDGQPINYQNAAMAAAGVVWRFRYRAASVSAYKWEFVGGSDYLSAEETGEELTYATSATPFSWISYGKPLLTTPLTGFYDVGVEATVVPRGAAAGAVQLYLSVVNNATNVLYASGSRFAYYRERDQDYHVQTVRTRPTGAFTAGDVLAPGLASGVASYKVQLFGAQVWMRPVRVG